MRKVEILSILLMICLLVSILFPTAINKVYAKSKNEVTLNFEGGIIHDGYVEYSKKAKLQLFKGEDLVVNISNNMVIDLNEAEYKFVIEEIEDTSVTGANTSIRLKINNWYYPIIAINETKSTFKLDSSKFNGKLDIEFERRNIAVNTTVKNVYEDISSKGVIDLTDGKEYVIDFSKNDELTEGLKSFADLDKTLYYKRDNKGLLATDNESEAVIKIVGNKSENKVILTAVNVGTKKIDIEGVKFNYNPGDKPEAKAYKCDPWEELYDIEYEYWEEMETNSGGEPVPVKYWYSDEAKNNALAQDKKITAFEEGKTYMYSISLKAKGENKFGNNSSVRVNSTKISSVSVFNSGTILFVTAVKTIKPTAPVQLKHIDVIELNNATISFNVNDKSVFTGKTPDESPYIYQFECWQAKDGAGITSAEFFNQGYENHITSFENGKEYQYILYFKAKEGYTFTRDTKLKINGKYYNYRVSDWEEEPNIDEFQTTWRMYPDLTMTPIGNSQENPITPSEPEKPSQKPGAPTTPTQETENKTEQTKNETNNPKTGDNIAVYISVFAVAVAGITATMIAKKRNLNK